MVFIVSIEFFVFVVSIIAVATLAVVLSMLAVSLWFSLATLSVTFSRLAISLLISAGIFFTDFDLVIFENGFLNFLARFVIIYGVVWIASFIPRLEPAIGAVCTFFVSLISTILTMGIGFTIYDAIAKSETNATQTWWFYMITGIVVTIATLINWVRDIDRTKETSKSTPLLSKPIFVRIGRVLSSLIYGFIIFMILGVSLNTNFPKAVWLQYLILFVCAGIAYVADLFLFDRAAPKRVKN